MCYVLVSINTIILYHDWVIYNIVKITEPLSYNLNNLFVYYCIHARMSELNFISKLPS